jgi:hypothetical protein
MRKSVGHTPTAERENKRNKKIRRTSSDIGAEQENHNVGQGPTLDRKGLTAAYCATVSSSAIFVIVANAVGSKIYVFDHGISLSTQFYQILLDIIIIAYCVFSFPSNS